MPDKRIYWPGYLAIIFYFSHALSWIIKGVPANLFWTCHLACLFVGIAIIFKIPLLNSISALWLGIGNVIWLIYLYGGGDFEPTSTLTHWGGIILAFYGVRKMGIAKYSKSLAISLMFIFQIITRYITPESENINLAFSIPPGYEKYFSSYLYYDLYLGAVCLISFIIMEILLRVWLKNKG